MSTRIHDRWLWLGFGALSLLAVHAIRLAIQDLVKQTKLDPYGYEPNPQHAGEQPEDAISPSTLLTLLDSPSPHIASSALTLLLSRISRSAPISASIRADLRSTDPATVRKATTAIDFLRQHSIDILPRHRSARAPYDNFTRVATFDRQRAEEEVLRRTTWGSWGVRSRIPEGDGDVVVPSVEDPVAGWTAVPRARPLPEEGSEEETEAERRRMRREAVVVHEGDSGWGGTWE